MTGDESYLIQLTFDGETDGAVVGLFDGEAVAGDVEGALEGIFDGASVVGAPDGAVVGAAVDGEADGAY